MHDFIPYPSGLYLQLAVKLYDYFSDVFDYLQLTVMLYDYFSNVRSTNTFKLTQMNKELSDGEDKSVWRNPVYAVIANMYNQWNEFFIPGGGMQFPLFVPSLPDYYNYGGMASLLSFQLLKAVDFRGTCIVFYLMIGKILGF